MSRRARIDLSTITGRGGKTSAVDALTAFDDDESLIHGTTGSGKTNTIVVLVAALRRSGMPDEEINERLTLDPPGTRATDVFDELTRNDPSGSRP